MTESYQDFKVDLIKNFLYEMDNIPYYPPFDDTNLLDLVSLPNHVSFKTDKIKPCLTVSVIPWDEVYILYKEMCMRNVPLKAILLWVASKVIDMVLEYHEESPFPEELLDKSSFDFLRSLRDNYMDIFEELYLDCCIFLKYNTKVVKVICK